MMAPELDPLSALAWLVEAGADEAVGTEPVNRLVAKPHPPLEGGGSVSVPTSKRETLRGGVEAPASRPNPSPKFASQMSTLP
ncbi:MAG TPA: hypothetical protein VL971_01225, partial [Rhizomicrobium sp.]|nr:hypothetical protein [Rhizomicrobium sp.]